MILARASIVAGAIALSACAEGAPETQNATLAAIEDEQVAGERETAGSAEADKCLVAIWEARRDDADYGGEAEQQFDRDNDANIGGAISCATATSATQFENTLRALREGATNADRAGILAEAGIPLLFIRNDGSVKRMEDASSLEAAFDEVFTTQTLAKLRTIRLEDMTVVPNKGGFFDLGALWLVVPEVGARPQLVTVNDQAATEAAAVRAREEAEALQESENE